MANLLGEPFREYVDDQIRVRQNVHGKKNRTTAELQYLNTRNAWIKMASAVSIDEDRLDLLRNLTEFDKNGKPIKRSRNNELLNGIYDGKNLALKNVLFGGLSSFGKIFRDGTGKERIDFEQQTRSGITGSPYSRAYGVGGTNQFGYSPMPGITDMSFKCLNRGSIKKMTLNIKCHNRSQFDVIDVLYLRLGYSVFVEWGYDKYLDNSGELQNMGSTLIDQKFWEDKYDKSSYAQWLPEIEAQREKTSGNYDGAFGVISNFSWTFEDDGTYNIKLEVTSLGDVIESLKVNLPSIYLAENNVYEARKFARLLESTGPDGTLDKEKFYNQVYKGLWDSVSNWYDRIFDGTFQPLSITSIQNIPAPGPNWYKSDEAKSEDFFSRYLNIPLMLEDHQFLNEDGNEWNNDEFAELADNDSYKISQFEIRRAIEYALNKFYGVGWAAGFKEDGGADGSKGRFNTNNMENNKLYDYYHSSKTYIRYSGTDVNVFIPQFGWAGGEFISQPSGYEYERNDGKRTYDSFYARTCLNSLLNAQLNGQLSSTNNKPMTKSDYWKTILGGVYSYKELGNAKTVIYGGVVNLLSISNKITEKYVNNRDQGVEHTLTKDVYNWNGNKDPKYSTYDKSVEEHKNIKTGPGKDWLYDYIYDYFLNVNPKAQIIPPSNDDLIKLEKEKSQTEAKGETFSKEKQAQLEKARSAREQEISDFKNQNKNRIYRFFYDIRQNAKVLSKQPPSTKDYIINGKAISWGSDILLPGGDKLGRVLTYIENESYYDRIAEINTLYAKYEALKKEAKKLKGRARLDFEIGELYDTQKSYNRALSWVKKYKKYQKNAKNILMLEKLSPVDNQGFIRLGAFLEFLVNQVIPKIDNTGDINQPIISIDTNTETNLCYVVDNIVSLDIQKIIVNNNYFINGLVEPNNENTANNTPIFPNLSPYIKDIKGGTIKYGQIMNIYFSFERLQEIFDTTIDKSDVFLFDALKNICKDINECLGNINNIEPIVDENNIIHFIDQTQIPGIEEIAKELKLPTFDIKEKEKLVIYGYEGNKSNFVRKIGLTTEISKNYATMITIGATANGAIPGVEATAFSRWNTGIIDRFKNNIIDATQLTEDSLEPIKTVPGKEVQNSYVTLLKETVGGNQGYGLFGLSNENNEYQINEKDIKYNAGIIEDFYKLMQAQNSYKDEKDMMGNTIESSVGFLPFNLKLDLDGISGIKIYNKMEIQQRFLPSNYPESLEFIITQVNHKLSNNDWITSLETIATSKSVLTDKKKKPTRKK